MDFKKYRLVYNFNVNTKRAMLLLMIKIFFITFFIAELIIAITAILKIMQLDKGIVNLNQEILANRSKIGVCFCDLRLLLENFTSDLESFKSIMKQKRQEYLLKFLKTGLVYYGAFISKGKAKKMLITYQLGKEIYEALNESEI